MNVATRFRPTPNSEEERREKLVRNKIDERIIEENRN